MESATSNDPAEGDHLGHPDRLGPLVDGELIDDRALEVKEDDQFGLQAMAVELADMCLETKTPANIAVFGPWGSGKSSLGKLTLKELGARRKPNVRTMAFDAFKYAENPLRRQFLSQVNDELELDSRDLYATTSKNRLTLPKEERKELFTTLLLSAAGIIALIVVLALFKAQWGSKGTFFWPTFTDLLTSSLPSVVFSATAIGLVVAFFGKQLTVKTDRSAPSTEEEFERVFEELLKEALGDDGGARLIVWIDELDRCNPGQVVSALETIRTFLEVKRCVFVVTADQKVLEKALDEAPRQATPADATNPYYSTGGAYLDKIFQYQMTLPPVLSRSLTSFARGLIEDRPGAWTLIESKADVVSVLIPTHVRSPRRVKVLLNSFLSTYRLALRRAEEGKLDGDVRSRAAEIAKLVCLRVEFPIFAAELRADPSLFERVTEGLIAERDSVEDPDSDDAEGAGSGPEEPSLATPFTSGNVPADELLLTGKVDKETLTRIRERQTQQLNGYLSKTATVAGPRRDLVLLDSAGSGFDLPSSISDKLEEAASNAQIDLATELVTAMEDAGKGNALRYLSSILADAEGLEQSNVLRTIARLVVVAPEGLAFAAQDLQSAIVRFADQHVFSATDLPGIIDIALAADNPAADELLRKALRYDGLSDDSAASHAVLANLDRIGGRNQSEVDAVLGARISIGDNDVISAALEALGDDSLAERIRAAASTVTDRLASREFATDDERTEATKDVAADLQVMIELLIEAGAEASAAATGQVTLELDTQEARNEFEASLSLLSPITDARLAMLVLRYGVRRVLTSWPVWLGALDDATLKTLSLLPAIERYTKSAWDTRFDASKRDVEAFGKAISAVSRVAQLSASAGEIGDSRPPVKLDELPAASTSAEIDERSDNYEALLALAAGGLCSTGATSELVASDLMRIAKSPATAPTGVPFADADGLQLLRAYLPRILETASTQVLEELDSAIQGCAWVADDGARGLLRMKIAAALRSRGVSVSSPLSGGELASVLPGGTSDVGETAAIWLSAFDPELDDLWPVINSIASDPIPDPPRTALRERLERLTSADVHTVAQRTSTGFLEHKVDLDLFRLIASGHLEDAHRASVILSVWNSATNHDDRSLAMELWQVIPPSRASSRRDLVAGVFLPLIASGKQGARTALKDANFRLVRDETGNLRARVIKALDDATKDETDLKKRWDKVRRAAGWGRRRGRWR